MKTSWVFSTVLFAIACSSSATAPTPDPDAQAAPAGKKVFITSSTYQGNLGGLAGADAACQAVASGAGLTGTFMAWVSTSTTNAADRLAHSSDPYVDTQGNQFVANWDALVAGTIDNPLLVDESGTPLPSNFGVWTGTLDNGVYDKTFGSADCSAWQDASLSNQATGGTTYNAGAAFPHRWSATELDACAKPKSLVCFEQ